MAWILNAIVKRKEGEAIQFDNEKFSPLDVKELESTERTIIRANVNAHFSSVKVIMYSRH